jgi:hypothetical protein
LELLTRRIANPPRLDLSSAPPTLPTGTKPYGAHWQKRTESTDMKAIFTGLTLALALAAASTITADAKGCIKGAIVGGVAGHYAGRHTWLGAATGCLVGRHWAKYPPHRTTQNQPPQQNSPADQGH